MKRIVIAAAMSLCLVLVTAISSADTLIMRDGTRVSCRVVSVAARTITVEDASGVSRRYNANEVDALEFTPASQRNAAVGTSGSNRRLEILPSGTELTVRTAEDIDSSTPVVDQTFSAIVERDIRGESDNVIIPAGSRAVLVVERSLPVERRVAPTWCSTCNR
jgi:hypothetical protein